MKKLYLKLLLACFPVLFLTGIYICNDPFKVIYHYNSYYQPIDSFNYELDDDYVGTQTLFQNNPKYKYDAYIFGSSRSDNYMVSEWLKYIACTAPYHFNAAFETLYGVEKKLQFIKKNNYEMKNVLFIFDNELLDKTANETGPIRLKHPALSGMSKAGFQAEFFKYFLDWDFLSSYVQFHLSLKLRNRILAKGIMMQDKFEYKVASNEFLQSEIENTLANDSDNFYNSRKKVFYERDTALHYTLPVIGAKQKELLQNIRAILAEKQTSYKIVINPLYNQSKLDTTDKKTLAELFGKEHIYDFSGKNIITMNKYNYYETSHYRVRVAKQIIEAIYKTSFH